MDRRFQDSSRRMWRGMRDMSDDMNRSWQNRRDSNMGDYDENDWRFQDQGRSSGGNQGRFENDMYGAGRDWGHGYSGRSQNFGRGDEWGQSGGEGGMFGFGGSRHQGQHEKGLGQRAMEKLGEFFGKGPKGYKRSDDRIREDVNETLWRHPSIDASELEVDVKDGTVTLRGQVDSRRTRRLVEETIEDLPGVSDVIMEVRIAPRGSDATWAGSSTISGTSAHGSSSGGSQMAGSSMGGDMSQDMSSNMGGGRSGGRASAGGSISARSSYGSGSKTKSRAKRS
ncbi:MAG TPA: BON domain-containing protein [Bdellovibrionales bacterium]|nr:BON domain-containing protein [Bdellovibrionales bacterium]